MTPFAGKMVSHGWEVLRSAPDARRLRVGRCSVAPALCRKGGHRNKHARPHVASARATGEPDSQKIESEGGAGDGAARTGVQAEEERRGWQADVGVPLSPRRSGRGGGEPVSAQQGQRSRRKRRGADGKPTWASRYRLDGRGWPGRRWAGSRLRGGRRRGWRAVARAASA